MRPPLAWRIWRYERQRRKLERAYRRSATTIICEPGLALHIESTAIGGDLGRVQQVDVGLEALAITLEPIHSVQHRIDTTAKLGLGDAVRVLQPGAPVGYDWPVWVITELEVKLNAPTRILATSLDRWLDQGLVHPRDLAGVR